MLFFFTSLIYAKENKYSIDDLYDLVAEQTSKGWWHKQVSTMPGNRYISSFKSNDYKDKLKWNDKDIDEGKIKIIRPMKLAKKWADDNKPFGEIYWVIEEVTYRFRMGNKEVEYICAVTLKTPEYKTIEIIILPNDEIIAPEINPKF